MATNIDAALAGIATNKRKARTIGNLMLRALATQHEDIARLYLEQAGNTLTKDVCDEYIAAAREHLQKAADLRAAVV